MMNQSERDCSTRRGGGRLLILSRKEGRRRHEGRKEHVTYSALAPASQHASAYPIYLHAAQQAAS
jgi:hypothetical protein